MMWQNLKENKCPQCGNAIKRKYNENFSCLRCGFFCRLSRAKEIVGDLDQKEFDRPADEFLKAHGVFIKAN